MAFERGEIDITFIFIQRKDKSAMVKYQLRPRQKELLYSANRPSALWNPERC